MNNQTPSAAQQITDRLNNLIKQYRYQDVPQSMLTVMLEASVELKKQPAAYTDIAHSIPLNETMLYYTWKNKGTNYGLQIQKATGEMTLHWEPPKGMGVLVPFSRDDLERMLQISNIPRPKTTQPTPTDPAAGGHIT